MNPSTAWCSCTRAWQCLKLTPPRFSPTAENGMLTALEWYDFDGCSSCGGTSSGSCIQTQKSTSQLATQQSCTISLSDPGCACRGSSCTATNCTTAYMIAFRGSTVSGQPLQSAYQMTAAFKYSITNVFGSFFDQVTNDLGQVNTGPVGTGVTGGTGAVSPSPLPLPSGAASDAALAAAQSGIGMPPPPPPVTEPPPAAPTGYYASPAVANPAAVPPPINPATGLPVTAGTPPPINPATGLPVAPGTPPPINPATGLPGTAG